MSLLTALIIQSNETNIHTYQDENSRMERENYQPLITCQAIYDSKQIARDEGQALITQIKALDLSQKR